MLRWVMLSLLCIGGVSGGLISFRLARAAATRDLTARLPPPTGAEVEVRASQRADKTMESDLGPRGLPAPFPDDLTAAREELRLIEEANAAVTRGDFASALAPLVEHERRFPRGWLSRERESLSVKAIDGLLISQPALAPAAYSVASVGRHRPASPQPRSALSSSRRPFRSRE
jgi:hypothetical protein